jgi:multicomponent Na+:H+ antiporter subunit E
MAVALYAAGLVVIWVLAWGSPSPANVLGGLAVAAVLLVVSPDPRPRGPIRIRPVAVARFLGHAAVQIAISNVQMTRAVLSRHPRIATGVVAVPLPDCSDGLITLITNVMALAPGTMPLEVRQHPTVVYVHVLDLHDPEEVRDDVRHLAALAYRAFGSPEAIAALDAPEEPVS